MFKKLCENLNALMVKGSLNASELARSTGLPASTIKKIRNHDSPNPTLATLLPLAQHFSVSLSQLIGDEPLPNVFAEKAMTPAFSRVPILNWMEAVTWPLNPEPSYSYVLSDNQYSQDAFALRVEESDWKNLIKETILFFDKQYKAVHGDYVLVYKEHEDKPTVRQLLCDEEHTYLKPLIEGYHTIKLSMAHKILGVLVEFRKQTKKIGIS